MNPIRAIAVTIAADLARVSSRDPSWLGQNPPALRPIGVVPARPLAP